MERIVAAKSTIAKGDGCATHDKAVVSIRRGTSVMRKCFLHIGRHKTGSSAIQWALYQHREELKRRGYLYPESGIPPLAVTHYNIAWELTKFSQYQPQFGTIEDLLAEIRACSHNVVISCEDFAIAIRSFADFQAFIQKLKDCGLAVVVVCYVRSPHEYLRSAFVEILKSESPVSFSRFITAMLDDEEMRWKDRAAGGRDRVVDNLIRLSESGDTDVVVRSYDDARASVVADFFTVIGLNLAEFPGAEEPRRNEANATEQSLALFFQNVTGRAPDAHEHALIAVIGAAAPMSALHMSEPAWRLVAKKYAPEIEALASRFGVRLANPAGDPTRRADHSTLEEVFCEPMVGAIQSAARRIAEEAVGYDRAYADLVAHYKAAIAQRDALAAERDALAAERGSLARERDAAAAERDSLTSERAALVAERDALVAKRDEARCADRGARHACARARRACGSAR
jgi:hypothetical protein